MAKKKPAKSKSDAQLNRELAKVDSEILSAINARAKLCTELSTSDKHNAPKNKGPLSDDCVQAVFRELASGCQALDSTTRVAYLGPEFTFTHLAAIHRFGQSVKMLPAVSIAAVFEDVERGDCDYGIVPLENSTDGRVTDTLDCFSRVSVRICGEIPLRIHHCLLGTGKIEKVNVVYSKPQALSQCRKWLAQHLAGVELREVSSTAEAAKLVQKNPRAAAIASKQAATNYELPLLAKNIEDNSNNVTRFAVIGNKLGERTGDDKTALMLELAHEPGALADSMTIFKRQRLNMTWIESFPIPGSLGRYLFFIEFVGHPNEAKVKRALASLEKKVVRLTLLGSYARTEPVG